MQLVLYCIGVMAAAIWYLSNRDKRLSDKLERTIELSAANDPGAEMAQRIFVLHWEFEAMIGGVPAYMVGVGAMPTHNNVEALTQQYYAQCLQIHVESYELALGQGLGIPKGTRVQLDIDGLFRTDTATKMEMLGKGINDGLLAPDEGRKRVNLKAVPGGEFPYLQQQNYSLEALAQRDATNPLAAPMAPEPISTEEDETKALMVLDALISKSVQKEA